MRSPHAPIAATVLLIAAAGCRAAPPTGAGVAWHRFPVSEATRVEPAIAIIYSSDDIGPTATLARLGYPDRMLFDLHRDHPQLKVVLMSSPANRYSGDRRLTDSPEAMMTWRTLALGPGFDWIDLGGFGYSHSPPDDTNLNHHEYSVRQSGCNIDHSALGGIDYCRRQMGLAREAYRTAGIPDDCVMLMRFPGMENSPSALEAAFEAGFLGVLDAGHDKEPGREWWTPLTGGGEILHVRNANALKLFAVSQALEEGLSTGRIAPSQVTKSPEFAVAVSRGTALLPRIESTGGLLNLADRWSETFREIGGTRPRYLVIDAVLREIETRYGPRAWYPTSRELVLWLDALRHSKLSRTEERGAVVVTAQPPEEWAKRRLPGLDNASLRVEMPGGTASRIEDIVIREGDGEWLPLDRSRWWMTDAHAVVLFPFRSPVSLRLRFTQP